ncbi:MAG: hypothetical protein HKN08_07010, partial [Gammaproteobacteria bacterium]|nr:hypothetical protein [Gammaproteobacteria bacterium]
EGGAETGVSAPDETLLPGHNIDGETTIDSENETLMPDAGSADSVDVDLTAEEAPDVEEDVGLASQNDDETLMPGALGDIDDEDDTIRPGNKSSDE